MHAKANMTHNLKRGALPALALLGIGACSHLEEHGVAEEDQRTLTVSAVLSQSDGDGDGLTDSFEGDLLWKFAPLVWLDSSETSWPVNVGWMLSESTLRFSHKLCPDHSIIGRGGVTRDNLTTQSHQLARDPLSSWPWDACDHYSSSKSSSSYVGTTKDTFFLQQMNTTHSGIRPAQRHLWEIYGHVFQTPAGEIEIQYWQLYAYNDSFGSFNHEGDWEYTSVVIDKLENVKRVIFFRHGRDVAYNPSEVQWVGNHHVTYSAKGSHGQYRNVDGTECEGDGLWDRAQGFADNCSAGTAWETWGSTRPIVNVGEKYHPLNNSNWIRYSGLWGEVGNAADVIEFTSGPRGPAYQGSWRGVSLPGVSPPIEDLPPPPTANCGNKHCQYCCEPNICAISPDRCP